MNILLFKIWVLDYEGCNINELGDLKYSETNNMNYEYWSNTDDPSDVYYVEWKECQAHAFEAQHPHWDSEME